MLKQIVVIFLLITLTVGCIETEVKKEESDVYPTFDIDADVETGEGYNSHTSYDNKDKEFTVPGVAWSYSGIIRDIDNNVWDDPRVEFTISLEPQKQANVNDRETVYISMSNLDTRIEFSGGSQRLITKSGGWYRATWRCGSDMWYEDGSLTLNVLDTEILTLDLDVNQVGMSHLPVLEKRTIPIVFSNIDNTWSSTYNVTFMVIKELSL